MYRNLSPEIKALILDMDGVIWKGDKPIGDIEKIFKQVSSHGLRYAFATNNSTLDQDMYVEKLSHFGVQAGKQMIANSSMAIAKIMTDHFPSGGGVFIVGEKGLFVTMEKYGFNYDNEHPLAVVAGMDREVTYEKLAQATYFIRNGATFFGTNPDLTFPTPRGLAPGAGSILAAIKAATDIKPILGGKPEPTIVKLLLEEMQLQPEQVLVIGDRLDTDILSGKRAGCKTALVLSGVATIEEVNNSEVKPDMIAENLTSLLQ